MEPVTKKRNKRYWHTESNVKAEAVMASKMTVDEFMKVYSQPKWCEYPDALQGNMGCWSLVDLKLRKKISPKYCKTCDCFNPEKAKKLNKP